MLSYQHGFHAGNLADVHKHALLAAMLGYLTAKDKPLTYIETHAGRGLYDLAAPKAIKTGEATAGITRALAEKWFPASHPLARALEATRAAQGATAYPGSPLIAAQLLRPFDKVQLAELHPQEHAALTEAMRPWYSVIHRQDGLALALSLTPPEPRRGLMLIDPSYEVKSDYDALPRLIGQIHARWNVGVIALWYPILGDDRHLPMRDALRAMALPKTLSHEVRFPAARDGHGMIGSGLFVVNTPFGTEDEARRLSGLFARL